MSDTRVVKLSEQSQPSRIERSVELPVSTSAGPLVLVQTRVLNPSAVPGVVRYIDDSPISAAVAVPIVRGMRSRHECDARSGPRIDHNRRGGRWRRIRYRCHVEADGGGRRDWTSRQRRGLNDAALVARGVEPATGGANS